MYKADEAATEQTHNKGNSNSHCICTIESFSLHFSSPWLGRDQEGVQRLVLSGSIATVTTKYSQPAGRP